MSQPSPFAFQESGVWQQAMTLAEQVFAKTERFPLREHAGLAASMRDSAQRLASAIAANDNDAAMSNAKMLFTQATLAARLGHMGTEDAIALLVDVEAISAALITPVQASLEAPVKEEAPKPKERRMNAKPRERSDNNKARNNKRPDKRSRDASRAGDRRAKRNAN